MNSETLLLPGGVLLEMLPVPGVGLVGKCPITQAQWRAVMNESPSYWLADDLPVESVSLHDCQKLCAKLSVLTGREFRLATEREWIVALADQPLTRRAGWFAENSGARTHPVGQLEPNAFGLYDMHGNVWEWCEDTGDAEDGYKILRGGSCFNLSIYCRSAYRDVISPDYRNLDIGVRVVCVVRPVHAAQSLAAIVEQLASCNYRCEAGALADNSYFIELRQGARDEGCLASAPPCGDCAWCRMFAEETQ